MSKKGFSIVELAIVLVVIGIILSMAVKGRALVKAARYRAEVARIANMETKLYINYAKTDRSLPVLQGSSVVLDIRPLLETDYFTLDEMRSGIYPDFLYAYWLMITHVSKEAIPSHNSSSSNRYIWLTIVRDFNINNQVNIRGANVPWEYHCNIKVLMDDRPMTNRTGRVRGATNPYYLDTHYSNCDVTPDVGKETIHTVYIGTNI